MMHPAHSHRWEERRHDVASVFVGLGLKEEGLAEFAKTQWAGLILIDKACVHDNTMPPESSGENQQAKQISHSRNLAIMIVALESESE